MDDEEKKTLIKTANRFKVNYFATGARGGGLCLRRGGRRQRRHRRQQDHQFLGSPKGFPKRTTSTGTGARPAREHAAEVGADYFQRQRHFRGTARSISIDGLAPSRVPRRFSAQEGLYNLRHANKISAYDFDSALPRRNSPCSNCQALRHKDPQRTGSITCCRSPQAQLQGMNN